MKFYLSSLNSRLDTAGSVTDVCEALNKIGLDIGAVENKATVIAGGLSG